MPGLQTIDVLLDNLGYTSGYALSIEKHRLNEKKALFSQPLAQTIDIVIPTHSDNGIPTQQLVDILGKHLSTSDSTFSNNGAYTNSNKTSLEHKYKHNEQQLNDAIDEFLSTEKNYICKLQALVNTIVKPLKLSCAQDKRPILKQYMCTNIFLNLEHILELHQHFMKALSSHKSDFATVCSTYMGKMERYRRYLLKVNNAHELHSTEYQKNQQYRSFIIKAITNPVFEKLLLKDLLDQPWKRITAYTLLIKDIRNYTYKDHPDFDKLTDAFNRINTIASVRDDIPTILATKSHDLYLSIRKAPCHLINQNRSLVTHLDAVEINQITGKLSRHVTLFLFCDKIMVASRSSHAKGANICGDDRTIPGSSPLTHLVPKKKKGLDFKFCGWMDLEHIDIYHGPSDIPDSIMIRASSDFQDSVPETGYEKYFQKGARIFACNSSRLDAYIQEKDSFVDTFYETRAAKRQHGDQDTTYHRLWNGFNVYSNVYDYDTYTKVELKNKVTAILLGNSKAVDFTRLLNSSRSSPWIVALIQPDSQGLKLKIRTKIAMTCSQQTVRPDDQQVDFSTVFWNNVIKCERDLRCSPTYRLMHESIEEQDAQRPILSRPRSRSRTNKTRSTSISNISRLFSRSRSQSPFSSSSLSSSLSSSASSSTTYLALKPSRSTPSQQQISENIDTAIWQRRSCALSMSNDSNGPTKGTSVRRRKLSYDASFFKVDMKASTSITTEMDTKSSNLSTQKQQSLSPLYQNTPKPGIPSTSIVDPFAMMQQSVLSPPSTVSSKQPVYYRNGNAFYSDDLTSYPATIDSHEKQQLVEKLDAMYQDITGIDISNGKGQQRQQQRSRYTSDPLAPGSPHHSSPPSVSSSVLSNTSQQATDIYDRKLVNLSSRSSSFTSIFSTHTSRSSLSSISLEDVYDQPKAYGPSPRLTNGEMIPLLKNYLSRDQTDGEIACKIMSDLTTNQKSHTHRSLLSRHTFATDDHHHEQQRPSSTKIPTPMTTLSNPMVMTAMEKQLIFDHIAATLDSCSSQFGPRLQIIMDKQGILGNEVNQVVNLLAPRDPTDTSMLTKVYRETMDETSNFFNKLNTEIVEISTLVNAYRQKYHQQQQQVNASTGSNAISSHLDANTLLQRKLEKIQQEKEYWQRRTSELTDQINQFALKR